MDNQSSQCEMLLQTSMKEEDGRRQKLARGAEAGVLFMLVVLVVFLPVASLPAVGEIALFAGVFLWLLRMGLTGKWEFIRTPLDIPLAAFLVAIIISVFTAVDPAYTFRELHGEFLKSVLIFYLAVNNLQSESRLKLMILAILAGALMMDSVAFLEHVWFYREPFGLHASKPQFWTWSIQVAPFLLLALFQPMRSGWRGGLALLVILHMLALYWTNGRMILLIIALEVSLVLYIVGLPARAVVLVGTLGLVLLIIVSPRNIIAINQPDPREIVIGPFTIYGLKESDESGPGSRLFIWETAWGHLKAHPFKGLGFGRRSFVKAYPEIAQRNSVLWHPHNTFLTMAVGLGVQGLAVFIWLLFQVLKTLLPGREKRLSLWRAGPAEWFIAAAFIMTIGYFTGNLTNDLYADDHARMFWLLVGCAFSMRLIAKREGGRLPVGEREPG